MAAFPASVAAYGKPGGGEWTAGDRLVLTDLGRTLRAIATDGPDAFYKGWIADRIAEDMKANGGLITKEDLAAYQAKRTAARARHVSRLRHHLDAAAQLRRRGADRDAQHPRAAEPEADEGPADRPALHLQAEAMRRAYLDRARFLGDPDFGEIPVARLTSKSAREAGRRLDRHAARLRAAPSSARTSSAPRRRRSPTRPRISRCSTGTAWPSPTPTRSKAASARTSSSRARASCSTTRWATSTRSRATTNATGDIGTPANLIAPGKRMLSSMTPTIVTKNGKVVLVTGSPGRPHDHQHRADRRARRHGVRPDRPRSGRPAAHPPSVDAGPDFVRGRPAEAAGHLGFEGAWARARSPRRVRATRTRSGSPPTGPPTACPTRDRPTARRPSPSI